ncbi:gluconate 2-dehydrogenase subunit 3 family protein [Sporosarcina sp. PTS2304]|uniref:gluconate 2-dehydrogenase subunit 3 family protein n=1 Tax=Sporosarcina sp. PTS2304 TaxID=2283194 RepID=UPI000E0CE0F7|nr:gluconate 2-dehydrogenase subunit 3 family protein [Sporosarcina sp. PTS2304]AXI00138.1 gluconate 2-dehydrogenase subunit 3 family protein [Sporosarcina sp. PTS2304]
MTEPKNPDATQKGISRRNFMKNTGLLAGGLVGGSLFGGLLTNQMQKTDEPATVHETNNVAEARIFFSSSAEFDILSAATERLFPKDSIGPGAIELGVPYFIDRQLAGEWGTNAKEYMRGPFLQSASVADYENLEDTEQDKGPNAETQVPVPSARYQTRMTRGEIFIEGIHAMELTSKDAFDMGFTELSPDQQDEILQLFDEGKAKMNGVSSATFFNLLLQTTIEGAYADPVYGGNRNMEGWRMKEYPGPRASYTADIEKEDFIVMKPVSLKNYQGH